MKISKKYVVTASSMKFCYIERGDPTMHPTLLLIHGYGSSKGDSLSLYEHFPRDMHVISIDLPGHGETPLNDGVQLNTMMFVNSVREVSIF